MYDFCHSIIFKVINAAGILIQALGSLVFCNKNLLAQPYKKK
jgi:hypothetical protein